MKSLLQIALCVPLAVYAMGSYAQSTRAGKWEFTLQPQYTDSSSFSGSNGSTAEIDSDYGFGFGVAYNLSDHFSLGGELTWSQADYTANVIGDAGSGNNGSFSLRGELFTNTLRFNGTWNILAGAFTPFLSGGIGATYVDTDVPDGPPQSFCWWDPWWGYYCGTSVPTKNETYFSYMAGAGLRWDSPQSFFLRGMVSQQFLDVGGAVGTLDMTQYRIDLGWKF
ncbi:MAG TPA: outer membrane beta-barrel protein [Burkholderiales bacterium]|nr:outer membrane beta-barrel protein [Burkholderiales bacterium]